MGDGPASSMRVLIRHSSSQGAWIERRRQSHRSNEIYPRSATSPRSCASPQSRGGCLLALTGVSCFLVTLAPPAGPLRSLDEYPSEFVCDIWELLSSDQKTNKLLLLGGISAYAILDDVRRSPHLPPPRSRATPPRLDRPPSLLNQLSPSHSDVSPLTLASSLRVRHLSATAARPSLPAFTHSCAMCNRAPTVSYLSRSI